jgi:hypothetical protein
LRNYVEFWRIPIHHFFSGSEQTPHPFEIGADEDEANENADLDIANWEAFGPQFTATKDPAKKMYMLLNEANLVGLIRNWNVHYPYPAITFHDDGTTNWTFFVWISPRDTWSNGV